MCVQSSPVLVLLQTLRFSYPIEKTSRLRGLRDTQFYFFYHTPSMETPIHVMHVVAIKDPRVERHIAP